MVIPFQKFKEGDFLLEAYCVRTIRLDGCQKLLGKFMVQFLENI